MAKKPPIVIVGEAVRFAFSSQGFPKYLLVGVDATGSISSYSENMSWMETVGICKHVQDYYTVCIPVTNALKGRNDESI